MKAPAEAACPSPTLNKAALLRAQSKHFGAITSSWATLR
jgi:hypothetical protein